MYKLQDAWTASMRKAFFHNGSANLRSKYQLDYHYVESGKDKNADDSVVDAGGYSSDSGITGADNAANLLSDT